MSFKFVRISSQFISIVRRRYWSSDFNFFSISGKCYLTE